MTHLVIIRGNSGSGKTTLAHGLRSDFSKTTMLVSQDVIRRDILNVKDTKNNLAINLIEQIVGYGRDRFDLIILEGIFAANKYEQMMSRIIPMFESVHAYYYHLPFDETYLRHLQKEKVDFGLKELEQWWVGEDYLCCVEEKILTIEDTLEESIIRILGDLDADKI